MSLSDKHFWPPRVFAALDEELSSWERARFVILPVPYDATTTWRVGTRTGAASIIDASLNMELWDYEFKREVCECGIFTAPDVEPDARGPEQMIERIRAVTSEVLAAGKIPIMLGGEHSLTLGAVQAAASTCEGELTVLQLDAHTDLRHTYGGSPFGHGCVSRRMSEIPNVRIVQVGLRSTSREEWDERPANVSQFWADDILFSWEQALHDIEALLGPNIYITYDVDASDPSWIPETGTPEPGGLSFHQVRDLLRLACSNRRVIGADCVELIGGHEPSAFAVARLLYKMMGYITDAEAQSNSQPKENA
jgi:agmatinase